ncbi:MAG TPA: hypothetical protein VEW68_09220 [Patescibacteria group bacterium]|nr:hypothetical protein [Patescibacteria group bacterium]
MRRGFGLIGLVATAILLAVVGAIAYNIGWSDGVNTHLPQGVAGAPYYYGYGPHFFGVGFGIFGFLWFLFVVFVLFSLVRFAFFGGRIMKGGWGHGGGFYGYGPGHGVPPGIEERMQEWHKRAHGEAPAAGDAGAATPPPPDQRTV